MDKRKRILGTVLLGIGLSLFALGFYIVVILKGNRVYEPGVSVQILLAFSILCGLIFYFFAVTARKTLIKFPPRIFLMSTSL
jgi:hypothetical protein